MVQTGYNINVLTLDPQVVSTVERYENSRKVKPVFWDSFFKLKDCSNALLIIDQDVLPRQDTAEKLKQVCQHNKVFLLLRDNDTEQNAYECGVYVCMHFPILDTAFFAAADNVIKVIQLENERISGDTSERIINQTGQLVYDYDISSGILEWMGASEWVSGFTLDELVNFNIDEWADRIHPNDRPKVLSNLSKAIAERGEFKAVYRFMTKSRHYKWIEERGECYYKPGSDKLRMAGCMIDISDTMKLTRELTMKEERFNGIIENAGEKIWVLDDKLNVVLSNTDAKKFFKDLYDIEINSGTNFLTLLSGNDLDFWMKLYSKALQGEQVSIEKKFEFNKDALYLDISVAPVTGKEQTGYQVSFFARDVSMYRKINASLNESQQRFKALVETTNDWIWEVDEYDRYVYCSPAVNKLLGYNEDELLKTSVFDIIVKKEKENIYEQWHEYKSKEKPFYRLDKVCRHKDGHIVILEANAVPVFKEDGTYAGYRGINRDVTAEAEYKKKQDRLNNLINSILQAAGVGIYNLDRRGYCNFINASALNTLGLNSEDTHLSFVKILQNVYHENRERENIIEKVCQNGESIHLEEAFLNNSNYEPVPVSFSAHPVKEGNTITGAVISFNDLTEWKKSEEKARESEQRLKEISDAMTGAVYQGIGEDKLELTYVSQGIKELVGVDAQSILDNSDLFFGKIIEEDRKSNRETMRKAINEHKIWSREFRIRSADGTLKWLHVNAVPSRKEDGTVFWHGAILDVTDRINAETRMMEFNKALEDSLQEVFIFYPDDLRFIYVNKGAKNNLGFDKSELRQMTASDIDIDLDDQHLKQMIESLIKNEKNQLTRSTFFLRKDGSVYPAETYFNYVTFNSRPAVMILAHDITERKQYEKELLERNKELKEANRELDQFVYSTSHDLRAPLASVEGLISLAQDANNESDVNEYLNLMQKSINKLDHSIDDILNYSKNKRSEIKPELIDFNELINETFNEIAFTEQNGKHVKLILEVELKDEFYTDKYRLLLILKNILGNAVKYHDYNRDDPWVQVRVFRNDNSETEINITDNGPGIPSMYLDKIFNMFFRGDKSSKGSGLGLYIVKAAVSKIHGTIDVSSFEGKGTTFVVRIPNMKSKTVKKTEEQQN